MGPTGAGKTELTEALDPARFEVISCDSRQIYREMEIGTAAPDTETLARMPHHLVGIISPAEEFSAGRFARRTRELIHDIDSRGKQACIVGGSGFYFRALKSGMFGASAVPPEVRDQVMAMSPAERLQELEETDPAALNPPQAREQIPGLIHRNDEYRIARALEVFRSTGRTWSEHWQAARGRVDAPEKGEFDFRGWKLETNQGDYWDRLLQRACKMIKDGLLEETRAVLDKYGPECPGLRTLGYDRALDVVQGRMPAAELPEELMIRHRQYGKKQRTWFKREADLESITAPELARELRSDVQ